jgi:hypothetical protein
VGEMGKLLTSSKLFFKRNGATILSVTGGIGVVATTVSAVMATPKALRALDQAKEEKGEKLTKLEYVVVAGPTYIPSLAIGVGTIACILGANVLNKQRQAALIGAYTLLDSSYKEYKQKVLDLYGENANNEVTAAIAKDKYDEDEHKVEPGKQLFYEAYSGRYFESTMEDVLRAEYTLNRELSMCDAVSLNDYYELLGLQRVDDHKDFGWYVESNMEMYWQTWVDFNHSTTTMDDGLECTIITMWQEPVIDYEYY